ncbi:hypothetical protein KSP40_PGU012754 [Platanthera guangdongensis]|uniref:Uncharacterized protein n=1 Tax=Platanthera guangdongensis TaxID=2320717 RepID=A0ABR2LHS1_9ASPA
MRRSSKRPTAFALSPANLPPVKSLTLALPPLLSFSTSSIPSIPPPKPIASACTILPNPKSSLFSDDPSKPLSVHLIRFCDFNPLVLILKPYPASYPP